MRKLLFLLFVSVFLLSACGSSESEETTSTGNEEESNEVEDVENAEEEFDLEEDEEDLYEEELTEQEETIQQLVHLFDEGVAFDAGSYTKGDIPEGEYAFVTFEGSGEYYSEVDASGDIIDNENFSSFGYVYVHEAGNIETSGALIDVDSLEELDVEGAKELYEVMNESEDYSDSGWYKVGVDIEPGEHKFKSYGSGYIAAMSGPVGKNEIVQNDNFDGEYSIKLQEGQYLVISKATIIE